MFEVFRYLFLALLCLFRHGKSEVYETVAWTPLNPKFQDEVFHLNVLPMSALTVLCPNQAMFLKTMDKAVPKEELFENFWIVDNTSFHTCNVNKNIAENKMLLRCDKPSILNFIQPHFKQFSASGDDPVYVPGKLYYFISTSSGFQNSLNNTSGGHCQSANMRMEIYVCKDDQDAACQLTEAPSVLHNNTTTKKIEPATQASRKSTPWDIWHLLTIIFGVAFAISLVIHSICLFCVCSHHKAAKKKNVEKDCLNPEEEKKGLENNHVLCEL